MTHSGIEQLKLDEGFRGQPYKCSAGKTTIAYGRNLEANPLTEDEAEYLLLNDLRKIEKEAHQLSYFKSLSKARQDVVINMIYNLGITRYLNFRKMNNALNNSDYKEASKQMLDSKWAIQVGARAKRLSESMRKG